MNGEDKEKNNLNTSDIIEEKINNKQNEKINKPEINTTGNNKNDSDFNLRAKRRSRKGRRKESKTSNLVYKIGLFLDILITALLVYLAIKISLLFLISLVVTLPIGIFCAIKLCGCCLGPRATTITFPYNYKGSTETTDLGKMPDQDQNIDGEKKTNKE